MYPPNSTTYLYSCHNETHICGIPIHSGSLVSAHIPSLHYCSTQYHSPFEFEPSRFDAQSDMYKSTEGKLRDLLAYVPFGFGVRKCPGQTLAMLMVKIVFTNVLLATDLKLEKRGGRYMAEILKNKFI